MKPAPGLVFPDHNPWPMVGLVALGLITILTIVHAVVRSRVGWAVAIVLAVPLALPAYWMVSALRLRRASSVVRSRGAPA